MCSHPDKRNDLRILPLRVCFSWVVAGTTGRYARCPLDHQEEAVYNLLSGCEAEIQFGDSAIRVLSTMIQLPKNRD